MAYIKSNDLFEQIPTEDIYKHIPHPIVIADHLMTPDNMGAMIRISDNIGALEMCFWARNRNTVWARCAAPPLQVAAT